MAGGTILQWLVAMVVCLVTVQPRLTQGMQPAGTMTVMADIRIRLVSIGLGQGMALIAGIDIPLERLVFIIQAVLPA